MNLSAPLIAPRGYPNREGDLSHPGTTVTVASVGGAIPASLASPQRIGFVDLLRGAVMVVMALDHARLFFSNSPFQPEDLAQSNVPLFFTRWITHFCAPVFFLLAGTGVGFALMCGHTPAEASRFLLTRGLWLVFLELTVVAIAWNFSFQLVPMVGIVIWALGWSMVCLALLIRLPRAVLITIGVAMIAGHNLFDGVTPLSLGAWGPLWTVLHVQGEVTPWLWIYYPLIPWIGVMSLGYTLADVYRWEAARRRRFLLGAGIGASVAFIALRAINGYGNPMPWTTQRSVALSVASFLNVEKYPPSLDYLLMTLGPMLVVLALLERAKGTVARWVTVFGRVPMLYYFLHLYLIHALAVVVVLATNAFTDTPANGLSEWGGVSLPGVYLVWALVMVLLYLPCRWFAEVKARRRDWWLSYL
jgi:uncharacterized membrane protein